MIVIILIIHLQHFGALFHARLHQSRLFLISKVFLLLQLHHTYKMVSLSRTRSELKFVCFLDFMGEIASCIGPIPLSKLQLLSDKKKDQRIYMKCIYKKLQYSLNMQHKHTNILHSSNFTSQESTLKVARVTCMYVNSLRPQKWYLSCPLGEKSRHNT